eukprot:3467015-Pyramimonas_sp.AAC.1
MAMVTSRGPYSKVARQQTHEAKPPIIVTDEYGLRVYNTKQYKHLGSMLCAEGTAGPDIAGRLLAQ